MNHDLEESMFIGYAVAVVLFAALLVFSGRGVLVKDETVVASLTTVGVPPSWFVPLAAVKFAGALGLLAGLVYRPLGIAAAAGVLLFFAGAVVSHLRVRDMKGAPAPAALMVLAVAPLTLGIASV
ncbi:DoxX family protein [Streptomyces sp. NPDC002209]|uniref:DoxX family protein n=1 Tax=Streptomyces sp. NPDC002209 TaxID=3364638 RepID=UPI0036C8BC06